jgi:15-cis-phytoene synthase
VVGGRVGWAVGMADELLHDAYRACARMQRRHDPTYYWATRALPGELRPAVHALYGYVRGADELVDGPGRPSDPAARRAALDAWQAELDRGLADGRSEHPVIAALVDAGPRHGLPLELLPRYLDSMRVDCDEPVRIRSRDELEWYMEGSAATVGRLMAAVLRVPDRELVAKLGVAFQLTNFIRDVHVDWQLDRLYLPGLDEDELQRGVAGPHLRATVREEVAVARRLFAETGGVVRMVPLRLRPGIRAARAVYERVLDRVEANEFDVVRRRAALRPWEAAGAMAGGLAGAR